jgi:ATP-dependent Zn protease
MNCQKNFSSAKLAIAIIVFALLTFGIYSAANSRPANNEISFDEALSRIQSSEIKAVTLKNNEAKLGFKSGGELIVSKLSEIEKDGIFNAVNSYNSENYNSRIALTFSPAASNPMDRVFQIIFILFFISPPLIVILLFLIWCEMKKRNDK